MEREQTNDLVAPEPREAFVGHTPGPWHVESKKFPYVLDSQSQVIATAPFTEQGRYDAPLLAAAPELLAERDSLKIQRGQLLEAAKAVVTDNTGHITLGVLWDLKSAIAAVEPIDRQHVEATYARSLSPDERGE